MQRLEVSGAVRLIYRSLGVKGLRKIVVAGRKGHRKRENKMGGDNVKQA